MRRKLLAAMTLATMAMSATALAHEYDDDAGAVYAMTNAPDGNQVVVFNRDADGMLKKAGMVSTQGTGSGGGLDALASQGSVVLSQDQNWLLAANAGSNDISVFRASRDTLEFADKASAGNMSPVSIAVFHDLVYVLGMGTAPGITGFQLTHSGKLMPLPNSTRLLGSGSFAQVSFDPDGDKLVITDKAGKRILVYSVGENGVPAANPVVSTSAGITPFGMTFDRRGHLLVVEATSNAVSSYDIRHDDSLQVISASVLNGQKAACWIATNGHRYAFTTNPGTQSLSSYRVEPKSGSVTLIAGVAGQGNRPLDLATTHDGRFLYALDPGSGTIDEFRIEHDGSLINLGAVPGGFSIFAQGIAVR